MHVSVKTLSIKYKSSSLTNIDLIDKEWTYIPQKHEYNFGCKTDILTLLMNNL